MATLKNTTINGTDYLRLPKGTTAQRPGNDAGRIRYNTDNSVVEYYQDGTYTTSAGWSEMTIPFLTRTIINNGYMQGGYQSSVAWNNLNRTITATDTTYNLGDGAIEAAFNYQWGACSKDYAYVFGAGGGHSVSSNYTIAFNMRTETQATDIDRNLALSRHNYGGVFREHYETWLNGENTLVEEYNLTTKTLTGTIGATMYSGTTWGMSTETYGIMYEGNNGITFNFSTRTASNRGGTDPANHHQQKAVNSKGQYAWAGNEGTYRGGNNYRRTNWTTNTTSGTVSKPVGDSGEENYTMGQDHQYMIGMYNGQQNNISHRWNYVSESGFRGGSSMEPKGKPGASSGVCSWRD